MTEIDKLKRIKRYLRRIGEKYKPSGIKFKKVKGHRTRKPKKNHGLCPNLNKNKNRNPRKNQNKSVLVLVNGMETYVPEKTLQRGNKYATKRSK